MMKVKRLLIMMLLIVLVLAPITPSTHGETLIRPTMAPRSTITDSSQAQVTEALHSSPVMFIENVGQFADGARFQVRGGDKTIWLTEDEIWVTVVEEPPPTPRLPDGRHPSPLSVTETETESGASGEVQGVNIRLSFSGANPHPRLEPFNRLETVVSYFIGNDPAQWRAAVSVWGGVRYRDLYPGIDLEITSEGGHLVQRLVARPGADLSAVRLRVEGADAVTPTPSPAAVASPNLVGRAGWEQGLLLRTALGDFTLPLLQVEEGIVKPALVQQVDRLAFEVAHPFTVENGADSAPLSIAHPQQEVSLLYAGFLGGSGWDEGRGIAVDAAGNAYVTGWTSSSNFPAVVGPDTSYNGYNDAFVAKVNPSGTGLVYAGFLGGSANDGGNSIAVDAAGNAYVTGWTSSSNFPAVVGPDTSYNGDPYDAFVAKVNPSGTGLVYAGFLGGSDEDVGWGIAVDAAGNAYVTGWTSSSNFPAVVGPDTSYNGDPYDAFVAKVNPSGTGLVYAGFLGGSDEDGGLAIAVDAAGNAYVTGWTSSSNFPAVVGPDTSYNGGDDAFVAKVNPSGTGLVYAGFLGGSGWDVGRGIAVDAAGNAYVTGETLSSNFPAVVGPDTSYNGNRDAFVAKVNPSGTGLLYAGFLGGSGLDSGSSIAVDAAGNAYVTGLTRSGDFPAVVGPDTSYNGGDDVFVAKVNPSGTALLYAGFLGGSYRDVGNDIVVDAAGNAYVTGYTWSHDFPTVVGPDTSYNGGDDAFVAKVGAGGGAEPPGGGTRPPLILIPGIMGSYIYQKSDNKQLWPGIGDTSRDDLLRNLGPEDVIVRDAIRTYVFLTTKTRIYSPLIDFLKNLGYVEYPDIGNEQVPTTTPLQRCEQAKQDGQKPTLFVFAYDWRQSNRVSAQKLKEYIECVRSIHNDSRVDIIAHSMGGLVARRYLIDNPSSHHVARLITIATPFYGAARTMTVIATGKFPGVSDFSPIPKIYEGELKYVAQTAAGAHELLPSPAYGEQYGCFLEFRYAIGGAIIRIPISRKCATYGEFVSWINGYAPGSGSNTYGFHIGAQDNWTNDANLNPMPEYYHFVGILRGISGGAPQNTLSEVAEEKSCIFNLPPIPICGRRVLEKSYDQGDGTVPIKSAEHQGYRHPQAKIIRVYGDHNEILAKAELHTALGNILQGTFAQSADLSNTADLPVAEAYYLRAINVASLTITDSTGELPSTATFYQLDEGVYAAVLPTDGVYTATITLKPQEGAIIEMRNGTNDSTNRAVRYLDLPPGGNNQVQVVFSQTGFSYLKRDTDADGSFETDVPPSADVSGSGANDREAPTIDISASGPLDARTVTITATDASGVQQILYSLDGTTFQPYTGPLVVDATQTQFIYTFADDRIANRSGLLTYPLAWKIYLPLTIR
jgi:pimeloyl-ACP methyl ester carboxylesterase